MNVRVEIVNAFVDAGAGGNPAGVVLDADGLGDGQKLAVARKVGLSETAFVSASEVASFKLDFFTPSRRIAHCGHATIATFCHLRQLGRIGDGSSSKETVDGLREILVRGDQAFMEQTAPRFMPLPADGALERDVLASLGIGPTDLAVGLRPEVVSTGNAFMLLPLKNAAALASLAPNPALIAQISTALDLVGYYAFCRQTQAAASAAAARMFAPRYGIAEEAATGMAAGPLACYLHHRLGIRAPRLYIEQGRFMQPASPSLIQVDLAAEDAAIRSVFVGGRASSVSSLLVEI